MVGQYAQQGPKAPWRNQRLGHGGTPGTIGQYGCDNVTKADVATWAGWPTDPGQMETAFENAGVFRPEADGTIDLLPDNALELLWPARFEMVAVHPGRADAAIAAALPTPDTYCEFGLAWTDRAGHHTHFVPVVGGSAPDWLIGDSWDGVTKHLSSYGLGAVVKTVVERARISPAREQAAALAQQQAQTAAAAAARAKAAAEQAARDKADADAKAVQLAATQAAKMTADAAAAAAAAKVKADADALVARQRADALAARAKAAQAAVKGKPAPSWVDVLVALIIKVLGLAETAVRPRRA